MSLRLILRWEFGAIDKDVDEILEPLTPIRIEMWNHWRRFGSNSGAIDNIWIKCGAIDTISFLFSMEIKTWGPF